MRIGIKRKGLIIIRLIDILPPSTKIVDLERVSKEANEINDEDLKAGADFYDSY